MTTADRVLERARSQIGVCEEPVGSNICPYTEWYGMTGPWCAMFVSWCFHKEALPLPATISKGFAYTPSGAAWFKRQGRWTSMPAKGHVIFFDFIGRISHVGIVESVEPNGTIICIEGNTDERGGRTGGKVMRRARRAKIVGYGIPPYTDKDATGAPGASVHGEEEDDVLKRGDKGAEVTVLQWRVNQFLHGSPEPQGGLKVDGEFGEETERHIKHIQKQFGYKTSGCYDLPVALRMVEHLIAKGAYSK